MWPPLSVKSGLGVAAFSAWAIRVPVWTSSLMACGPGNSEPEPEPSSDFPENQRRSARIVPDFPGSPGARLSAVSAQLRQALVDSPLRAASLQLVAGTEVDELGVSRQSRMHLLHAPEHLLGDPAVVRVALRRRPQLAEVIDLAQRCPEVPAQAEGERHGVLGQLGAEAALEQPVRSLCSLQCGRELIRQAEA